MSREINFHLPYILIVALVALVAIVVLVLNQRSEIVPTSSIVPEENVAGEAITLAAPKIIISCSPLNVKNGGTVLCGLTLDTTLRSIAVVEYRVTQRGNYGSLFSVINITDVPKGFSSGFNPTLTRFVMITADFGLHPTYLGTIKLIPAGGTGSVKIYLENLHILDDQFNEVTVQAVPSALITVQ